MAQTMAIPTQIALGIGYEKNKKNAPPYFKSISFDPLKCQLMAQQMAIPTQIEYGIG